jgi:hypothetical protein
MYNNLVSHWSQWTDTRAKAYSKQHQIDRPCMWDIQVENEHPYCAAQWTCNYSTKET